MALDGGECAASGSVERVPVSTKLRLFGPRGGRTSVGNGTTVIRPVCSILTVLAELPWLVAWMMFFTIVPCNGLFCATFA